MLQCVPRLLHSDSFADADALSRRAIKARSHIIYNDTSHNSSHSVYLNIYQSFLIVALKFHAYIKEWGADPRRRPAFFLGQYRSRFLPYTVLTVLRRRHRAGHPVLARRDPESCTHESCSTARRRMQSPTRLDYLVCIPFASFACPLTPHRRLGHHAFNRVLRKTPVLYGGILKSLAREVQDPAMSKIRSRLTKVVHAASNEFVERPAWKR